MVQFAGLVRQEFAYGLLADGVLDGLDIVHELHRAAVADVENAERRIAGGGIGIGGVPLRIRLRDIVADPDHAIHQVVDIGEIAHVPAVIEQLDRPASDDVPRELEQRHVGPSPRPIDREEPQARRRQPEQMTVAVRHQFVGALGRRVELQGVIGAVMLAERQPRIRAIDAAGAGIDEVRRGGMAARLEDIGKADQVALDIGMRIFQAVAHAGLRGEMDHPVERTFREAPLHRGAVRKVRLVEAIRSAAVGGDPVENAEPRPLERRIVIVVDVVEPDHGVAALQQALRRVKADEAGMSGDKNTHGNPFCRGPFPIHINTAVP